MYTRVHTTRQIFWWKTWHGSARFVKVCKSSQCKKKKNPPKTTPTWVFLRSVLKPLNKHMEEEPVGFFFPVEKSEHWQCFQHWKHPQDVISFLSDFEPILNLMLDRIENEKFGSASSRSKKSFRHISGLHSKVQSYHYDVKVPAVWNATVRVGMDCVFSKAKVRVHFWSEAFLEGHTKSRLIIKT